ncbi:hypothetical protein DRO26_01070 [Candidatus Bathyarchaeota archaeon]|nr:MAG: hypothetical protein DRO26_01070 [Candidatus Bathyarchaeota archaeon]
MVKLYRKRYLLFKVLSEKSLEKNIIRRSIFESFQKLFGVLDLSCAKLVFLEYDKEKNLGILRCSHTYLDHVRACLAFIRQINHEKVACFTLRVSGTIKTIREFKTKLLEKL